MPLSSFLLKPMQRITRYPLHIKNVGHPKCFSLLSSSWKNGHFGVIVHNILKMWQFMLCVFRSWSVLQKATLTRFLWKRLWRGQKSFASRFGLHLLSLLLKLLKKICSSCSLLHNCMNQVNEGVREKENSDRLEWIQTHVQCEGTAEVLCSLLIFSF